MDSGFKSRKASESSRAKENVNLFQIKGTSELNTRAVEVILDSNPPPLICLYGINSCLKTDFYWMPVELNREDDSFEKTFTLIVS